MRYRITLVTPPLPTGRVPKRLIRDINNVVTGSGGILSAWADDGRNQFVCPLKGFTKGHRFILICSDLPEYRLVDIMKELNEKYLVATAVRIP